MLWTFIRTTVLVIRKESRKSDQNRHSKEKIKQVEEKGKKITGEIVINYFTIATRQGGIT